MPFEIAHPARNPPPRRFTEQQAWVQYPPDPARRYETPMLLYALAFYACYLAAIAGYVPFWAAAVLAPILLLRYFNRFHEALHADNRAGGHHPARTCLILMGPLYLGYDELRELHNLHHREEGSGRDPDALMLDRSPLKSLFWSFLQPEQSLVDYIQRFGLRPRLAAGLAARAAVWTALCWLGGWPGFLLFNATTRVGNTIAWFVFGWVVHGPWFWGQVRPPRLPRPIARLWVLLIGKENLVGIRFHFLHHVFPHIPDRHLPEVSRRMIV